MRIFDVTVSISELTPVWPGHPQVQFEQIASMASGDVSNVTGLKLGCHTGTHVDAPHHFVDGGLTVDNLPLELLMGPAFVAEMDRLEGNVIQVYDLASLHFPRDTERLLLKTSNSYFWEDRLTEFEPGYTYLSHKAAQWLVNRGVRLVGVDYMSVDAFGSSRRRTHQTLLGAGVVIVEGLNLSRVPGGHCRLVCLPLKIQGGDGAPARVLVIRD